MQEPGPGLAESMRSPRPGRAQGRGGAVRVHVLCCVSGAGGLSRRWGRHRAKASRHASHTKKKERRSKFLERRLQTCQGLVGDQVGREVWAGDRRPYVPRSTPPGAGGGLHCCPSCRNGTPGRVLFPPGKEPIQMLGFNLERGTQQLLTSRRHGGRSLCWGKS